MKKRKIINTSLALALIIFSCALVLIPLYFTVLNSFKPYPNCGKYCGISPKPYAG